MSSNLVVNGMRLRPPNDGEMLRFIDQNLGQRPWSKQVEIVTSVAHHRRTVVRSATGVGKTKGAADIALAWLYTGPYRCVVTTAPTARQVKDLLWKEIRKSYGNASRLNVPLGGTIPPSAPELRLDDDWMAIGFSSNDDVNFQGWHSPGGTLFILDEAMGVKPPVWEAIKSTLVGDWDRLLAIANPTSPTGAFYDMHKSAQVSKIHISAFHSPNVIEDRVVIPGLTTRAWIDERREEWGEDSPLWRARVLGEFPDSADNVLVPLAWMEAAIERWLERGRQRDEDDEATVENELLVRHPRRLKPVVGPSIMGLDVARYGDDKSIMAITTFGEHAIRTGRLGKAQGRSNTEIAGWAIAAKAELGIDLLHIDGIGNGGGVVDICEEKLGTGVVVDMQAGARPLDAQRFLNTRSEWAWSFREALRPDAPIPLELPPDDALLHQATSIQYRLTSTGQIALESKEDWRKRTKKASTDELDAVVMSLAKGYGIRRHGFTIT